MTADRHAELKRLLARALDLPLIAQFPQYPSDRLPAHGRTNALQPQNLQSATDRCGRRSPQSKSACRRIVAR